MEWESRKPREKSDDRARRQRYYSPYTAKADLAVGLGRSTLSVSSVSLPGQAGSALGRPPFGHDMLGDDLLHAVGVNGLDLEQLFGQRLHRLTLMPDNLPCRLVSLHDQRRDLVIDPSRRPFREARGTAVVVECTGGTTEMDRTERRHAEFADHLARQFGCTLDVVGPVSYTHLRAHETPEHLVCRLLL